MQRIRLQALILSVSVLLLILAACDTPQQTDVTEEVVEAESSATASMEPVTQAAPEELAPTSTGTAVATPTEAAPATATPEVEVTESAEATAEATDPPEPTGTAPPSPTAEPEASPTGEVAEEPPAAPGGAIVVDHTSVADFERIPEEYLAAAQQLRMVYIDQSVGLNISDGLTCLSAASNAGAPNHCARYEHIDPQFSVDPAVVSWERPGGYDRSNWEFQPYSSECEGGGWTAIVPCFVQMVEPVMDQYDVVSFQFTYLHVAEGSQIADQPGGFFWDNESDRIADVYDQEAFEARYPDKVFIYWTTSLARGIGTAASQQFNEQMRQYAIENGKPLFDVADILSHDPDGNPCYDNRDGVPYDNGNNVEDFPDDGQDYLAICQHYTTETEGGHLGRVSAGKIRVAKAFWVLMARIAGWDGR